MDIEKLKNIIRNKQKSVVAQNMILLQQGKHSEYSANCNFLRGISFVMQRIEGEKQ